MQRVRSNKGPLKILHKRERGRIQGLPKFFGYPPIISGTGKATDFKFGQYIQSVHLNKSPLKFLEKRECGRIQGLPKFLGTPYYISGTGKATDFQFGPYIQRVHPNNSPWKILEKRKRGRIHGLPKLFGYPYYLRNGKSYGFQIWPVYSEGPSEQNPIKNFREKGIWAYPGTAQFFGYPLLSQERGKLQISNLASTFRGSIRIKAH